MRKFKDTSTILPTKIIQLWYKNIHIKDIRYIFVQKEHYATATHSFQIGRAHV